jgi:glycerophosphoryl diester phosphodiesterase
MKLWLFVALLTVACTEAGSDADVGGASAPKDTAEDSGSEPWEVRPRDAAALDSVADLGLDVAPELVPDGTPDAGPAIKPPPKGPAPGLFDCTHDPAGLPGRLSPVPMNCVLDPDCREPMVVGHRGAGGDGGVVAPENSLSALRAAIVMGVDGVEVDVRVTSDEQLVLMHDDTLQRTAGVDVKVGDLSLEEITQIPLLSLDKWDGDFSCDMVPTFAEALALCKDRVYLDVDMKTSRGDLVAEAIAAAGMLDQAFVSTPSVETALLARATNPEVRLQLRTHTPEELQAGLDVFDPDPEIFEVYVEEIPWSEPMVHGAGLTLFTDVFIEDVLVVALGQPESVYLDLYAQGADVLQTEFPQFLVKVLGREFPAAD